MGVRPFLTLYLAFLLGSLLDSPTERILGVLLSGLSLLRVLEAHRSGSKLRIDVGAPKDC